ncbi:MAG: NAD(P)H-binding protein [Actinomycetota bacterium]
MSALARPVVLGAGPVGRAIVDQLVAAGHGPTVVTRSGTGLPGARPVAADLADPVQAKEAVAGATVVFQATQPAYHRWPEEFPALQRSIMDGAAATGAALIVVENLYGYGHRFEPYHPAMPLAATTRKGGVRATMWQELEAANEAGMLPVAAVRGSDFIGPHVTDSSYGQRFFAPLVGGGKAEVVGDPSTRHAVTYVPDQAATMIAVAADPDAWGRAWHAPCAPAVTQAELVDLAAAAAGVSPRHRVLKGWQLRLVGRFMPAAGEMVEMMYEFDHDHLVDWSETADRFGLAATPLAEVMAATTAWYRDEARS